MSAEAKLHLEVFLEKCIAQLEGLTGEPRLDIFFHYRYRELYRFFPHKPFSVEESTGDFFKITLQYLRGERSLGEIPSSEYSQNYKKWIETFL